MTIFSDNPHDRRIERFMTAIPNFKPRGVGVRFSESQILITVTAATPTEILTETMRQIRCPPFRKRFNEYIESEENPMTYINEKHRAKFELAARNVHIENYALLSALYLLTADQRLWSCCKHHEEMLCFIRAEYNGKTEYLYLPCEDEAIDKAFARLGAPTPDDVKLSWEDHCIESDKWAERFKEIAAEEGAYELNKLAAAVNCADMDMKRKASPSKSTPTSMPKSKNTSNGMKG